MMRVWIVLILLAWSARPISGNAAIAVGSDTLSHGRLRPSGRDRRAGAFAVLRSGAVGIGTYGLCELP